MSTRVKGPFRFDQVGSLLRTSVLKEARAKYDKKEISLEELTAVQQAEIKKLVAKEAEAGLKAVTDGEFSRSWWHLDWLVGLEGAEKYIPERGYQFKGMLTRNEDVRIVGKIKYNPNHPFFTYFQYLNSVIPEGCIAKMTIPSPSMLFRVYPEDKTIYDSMEEFVADIAEAYKKSIQRFYELGCRYLQIDDTNWTHMLHLLHKFKDSPVEQKPYIEQCENQLKALLLMLKDRPQDMTITTHLCRGNFRSTWVYTGGYEVIQDYLGQLPYDGLFLEYDSDRAGDLAPIAKIWNGDKNKRIVLGLVTSKFPELEDQEAIIARINEATKYVPLENLCLSTQCGFASTEEGNNLTEEEQWAKIKLVVETAKKVWADA